MAARSTSSRILVAIVLIAGLVHGTAFSERPRQVLAASRASILIVADSIASNPYGPNVVELLKTEGLRDIEVRRLAELDSALLNERHVVVLGQVQPSSAQVSALTAFVNGGGGLVAMRPVAAFGPLLGVSRQDGSRANGYLRITDPAVGGGLYDQTMQFHGVASLYALNGATQIAELYRDRTLSLARPAATLRASGTGKAAMVAYDMAKSVILTRQGNPANANRDMDGDGVVRTTDLYVGWIDLQRSHVPQADIQQRLLVRLIGAVSPAPLPQLWYFPNGAPTVLIVTADSHANPDAYFQTEIDALRQRQAVATFYLSQAATPSAGKVTTWQSQGFDFAQHPYVDCGYGCGLDNGLSWFQGAYGFRPRTVRTHQVRTVGWTGAVQQESQRSYAMDFNSYQAGSWLNTASGPSLGYITGSGQPMTFVNPSGQALPIFQQHTSLVDEYLAPGVGTAGLSLSAALAASRSVIDASVNDFYAPIVTQFHVDYFYPEVSAWDLGTIDYALQRGAVSLHAAAWLSFVERRDATTFGSTGWSSNVLSFTLTAGGADQTLLLPETFRGAALAGVTIDGVIRPTTPKVINGVPFRSVAAQSGAYQVSYGARSASPARSIVVGRTVRGPVTMGLTVTIDADGRRHRGRSSLRRCCRQPFHRRTDL